MAELEDVPGSYEEVDYSKILYSPSSDYLTSGPFEYQSHLLANTDVDSYEDPLRPTIGMDADNTWVLLWFYESDYPELKAQYDEITRAPYYSIITSSAEFSLDFGDGYFDNDLDVNKDSMHPDDDEDGISFSIGFPVGGLSIGIGKTFTHSDVQTDHEPNEYAEWEYTMNTFPVGQEEAAGIAFDLEANSRKTTAEITAEWNRGYQVVKYNERAQSTTIYTRGEGLRHTEEVHIE